MPPSAICEHMIGVSTLGEEGQKSLEVLCSIGTGSVRAVVCRVQGQRRFDGRLNDDEEAPEWPGPHEATNRT